MKSKSIVLFSVIVLFLSLYPVSICCASISGRVTRTDGNPEKGARITFTDESNPDIFFSTVTDDNGFYEVVMTTFVADNENTGDIPTGFTLHQNYPNPFNPSTVIPFSIDTYGFVELSLFNLLGQKVRTLIHDYYPAGSFSVTWDGVDNDGMSVAAGVYIYQMKQGHSAKTRKMLLLDGGSSVISGSISRLPFRGNSTAIEAKSVSSTPGLHAKIAGNSTYRVTITGQWVFPFELNRVAADDGDVLDFEICEYRGGGSTYFPAEESKTIEIFSNMMKIKVVFPANTFSKDVTVTIKHAPELAPAFIFPTLSGAGEVYHFDAEFREYDYHSPGPELLKTSLLTIPYDPAGLGVEVPEEDLFVAHWNGNSWMKANGELNSESRDITVETDHLGLWTVFYGQVFGDITVEQTYELIEDNTDNSNFVILDVRTPGEYESGYIQDAINIDYKSESFKNDVDKLDKNKTYLVYCLAGARSRGAMNIMEELGFIEVYNMLGGIRQWLFEEYPMVK